MQSGLKSSDRLLAKSLGDLPNVFYLLSFDREAVTRALKEGQEPVGPDFLEKIIQVQLKLPPPWEPEIRQLFAVRVDAIIGDVVPQDQRRWMSAFQQAVAPYFRTPRDVARFSNTLQVIWPNVVGDVDFTDLILMTTLQHFEPAVYQMVFENIGQLGGESVTFEDDKAFAARFVPPETSANRLAARKALAHLFPKLAKGWNEYVWDGTTYLEKREQRRICTREYYRNYFLFGRDPDQTSRAEIEEMLACANPSLRLQEMIQRLSSKKSRRGTSRVASLLDQILETVYSKPLLSESSVKAILDSSDALVAREEIVWEFFVLDNLERLESILTYGLTPLAMNIRAEVVKLISAYPRGLPLCARVISHLSRQHGLHGAQAKHESEWLVSKEVVEEAEGALLNRIRKAASDGSLLAAPSPMFIIWFWKDLGNTEEIKSWTSQVMKTDAGVLRLASVLPLTSYQSGGDGSKTVRSFKAENYKTFLDVDELKVRLNDIVASSKFDDAKQVRTDFLAAEEAGKSSRF